VLSLIGFASEHITDEILNDVLKLFQDLAESDEEFAEYMLTEFCAQMQKEQLSDPFVKLSAWLIGQIGASYCT